MKFYLIFLFVLLVACGDSKKPNKPPTQNDDNFWGLPQQGSPQRSAPQTECSPMCPPADGSDSGRPHGAAPTGEADEAEDPQEHAGNANPSANEGGTSVGIIPYDPCTDTERPRDPACDRPPFDIWGAPPSDDGLNGEF